MKNNIIRDLYRYTGKTSRKVMLQMFLRKPDFRHVVLLRLYQRKPLYVLRLLLARSTHRTHIEIGWHTRIGDGILLVHPSGIAVNNDCVIGRNCTIYGGVTLGTEFRGKRAGCPSLGDCVWIGPNATIVGNINIGDDVLIAPNSFVNFDVPSHAIVVGNPGKIIHRENATEQYIVRKV